MSENEKKIREIIDNLKPYLMGDGGTIDFIKYEDNIVYISLGGACQDCQMIDLTLKDGIESTIMEEVPEVKQVVNVIPSYTDYDSIF